MSNDFTLIYSSAVYLVYLTKLFKNKFGIFEIHATVFKPGSSKIAVGSKFALALLLGPNSQITFESELFNELIRSFPNA